MKRIQLLFSLLLIGQIVFAQNAAMTISDEIDEPIGEEWKVLQCGNGNTLFFNFSKKGGIDITAFDKNRKITGTHTIENKDLGVSNIRDVHVENAFAIDDDIMLFVAHQDDDKHTIPTRIIINSKDGSVRENKQLMPAVDGWISISKDPATDAYAILSSGKDGETLTWYGAHNKELAHTSFGADKTGTVKEMIVDGERSVIIIGSNATNGVVSVLSAGSNELQTHTIPDAQAWTNAWMTVKYNSTNQMLYALTAQTGNTSYKSSMLGASSSTTHYTLRLAGINTSSFTGGFSKPVELQKLVLQRRMLTGNTKPYSGMPIDFAVNADNTLSIIFQEQVEVAAQQSYSLLSDVGMLNLSPQGEPVDAQIVPLLQKSSVGVNWFKLSTQHAGNYWLVNGAAWGAGRAGYYSCDFLSTPSGKYIIFNDRPDNFDKKPKEAPDGVSGIGACNGICYNWTGGQLNKSIFSGVPDDSFDNRFIYLASGNYSPITGDYAALITEVRGHKKISRIMWKHIA